MFETETVGPCLVQKLKWEGHGLPGSPSGYTPAVREKMTSNFKVFRVFKLLSHPVNPVPQPLGHCDRNWCPFGDDLHPFGDNLTYKIV